ncbi:MAG: hypothetical protein AAF830_15700 [Pseudomonadota bacterium]
MSDVSRPDKVVVSMPASLPKDHPSLLLEKLNGHDARITKLEDNHDLLENALDALGGKLDKILWAILGGGAVWTAQEFGVLDLMKMILY